MKTFLAKAIALALLLTSPAAYAQAEQTTGTLPPVAPPLVREGDFAIKLVSALEIGSAENETEAEAVLASSGIAPNNGWISDYPVTPDIIGELQDAVAAAADSERLLLKKHEALAALEIVLADLGLSVVADTPEEYAETPPPASPQYTEPTVVNNYYYTHGPPVFTYYPPPPDYNYLYAWVPYPFWCSRFFFSGFFILHDFHKVSFVHNRVVVVTNHVFHRHHRRFFRVDPVRRRAGKSLRAVVERPGKRRFTRAGARRGAQSILQRSRDRMRSGRGPSAGTSVASEPNRRSAPRTRTRAKPTARDELRSGAQPIMRRNRQRSTVSTPPTAGTSVASKVNRRSAGWIRTQRVQNTRAFNGRGGERAHTVPRENFKADP